MKLHAPHTLADVDWRNFDYGTFQGPMHDGEVIVHLDEKPGESHDTISHRLRSVTYGNKRKSAAVVIERSMWIEAMGDALISSEIHIYRLDEHKPVLLGIVDVATPVHEVCLDVHGRISVLSGEPAVKQRFRLVDGEFIAVQQHA